MRIFKGINIVLLILNIIVMHWLFLYIWADLS